MSHLFVEALVLSSTAAVVGLMIAGVFLRKGADFFFSNDQRPFWLEFNLSSGLVLYVAGLTVLAAVIAGVVPALKATGRRVQAGLQQLSSRGSQMQLGRAWTALIVLQVAVAVAALPAALRVATGTARHATAGPGYPAHELVRTSISVQHDAGSATTDTAAYERAFRLRFSDRVAELMRRLEAEPDVAGATFTGVVPGFGYRVQIEGDGGERPEIAADARGMHESGHHRVHVSHIGVGFFSVFGVPVMQGRGLVDADARAGSTAVIVNRAFAERIAGSGNVLGRRVRNVRPPQDTVPRDSEDHRWFEIVGVVPDFPNPVWWFDEAEPRLYFPTTLRQAHSITLALRTNGEPAAGFGGRLRSIAAAVDPALELHGLRTDAEVRRQERRVVRSAVLAIVAPTLSVLLLSAAGIYAMMSFTVTRRRREIGIRVALGADSRGILGGIFARAAAQLGTGAVAGLILAAALDWRMGGSTMGGRSLVLLPAVATLIMTVGLLAALAPARRGLNIQPTEALREE